MGRRFVTELESGSDIEAQPIKFPVLPRPQFGRLRGKEIKMSLQLEHRGSNPGPKPFWPWRAGDDPPGDPTQTDDTAKAGGGLPLEGADEPLDETEDG